MTELRVGDHDIVAVVPHPRLGCWVECQCWWISGSFRTTERALQAHAKHVERAEEAANPTCVGDHTKRCCRACKTHSMPHVGCVLR